jgi:hypothetical protein
MLDASWDTGAAGVGDVGEAGVSGVDATREYVTESVPWGLRNQQIDQDHKPDQEEKQQEHSGNDGAGTPLARCPGLGRDLEAGDAKNGRLVPILLGDIGLLASAVGSDDRGRERTRTVSNRA